MEIKRVLLEFQEKKVTGMHSFIESKDDQKTVYRVYRQREKGSKDLNQLLALKIRIKESIL